MHKKAYLEILKDFTGKENDLIPILVSVQDKFGYIPEESIKVVSQFLKISENQIFGVASFYPKFRFDEPGKTSIKVCMGTACHVQGGHFLSEAVGWKLGISIGQRTKDMKFDFQRGSCLGCCTLAPVVQINKKTYGRMMVTRLKEILENNE
ncbi:MAG: NAD(P)H-dependent oxidoreductase subunit E [Calditrichia bacterium]